VNPKESKGFTSGARQVNPGFDESRGGAMNTESGIAHVGLGSSHDPSGAAAPVPRPHVCGPPVVGFLPRPVVLTPRSYVLNTQSEEKKTVFYSGFACFVNTLTLNMVIVQGSTGRIHYSYCGRASGIREYVLTM